MIKNVEDRLFIMDFPYRNNCYGVMVPIEDKDIFSIAVEVINRKCENVEVFTVRGQYICAFTFDGDSKKLVKEITDLIETRGNNKTEDVISIVNYYHILELNESIWELNDIINIFRLLGFNTVTINDKSFAIVDNSNKHSAIETAKFILPNIIIKDEENPQDEISRLDVESANLIILNGNIAELTEEFLTDPKYVVIKDGEISTNIEHIKETTTLDVVYLPRNIQSLVNIVNIFKNSEDKGEILVTLSLGEEDLECYLTEEEYCSMLEESKYMRKGIISIAF